VVCRYIEEIFFLISSVRYRMFKNTCKVLNFLNPKLYQDHQLSLFVLCLLFQLSAKVLLHLQLPTLSSFHKYGTRLHMASLVV
jgi:hypothetical protein